MNLEMAEGSVGGGRKGDNEGRKGDNEGRSGKPGKESVP